MDAIKELETYCGMWSRCYESSKLSNDHDSITEIVQEVRKFRDNLGVIVDLHFASHAIIFNDVMNKLNWLILDAHLYILDTYPCILE
jgi:hypothetical protein